MCESEEKRGFEETESFKFNLLNSFLNFIKSNFKLAIVNEIKLD